MEVTKKCSALRIKMLNSFLLVFKHLPNPKLQIQKKKSTLHDLFFLSLIKKMKET